MSAGTGGGAGGGLLGAILGSMIMPGVGTALGAAAGNAAGQAAATGGDIDPLGVGLSGLGGAVTGGLGGQLLGETASASTAAAADPSLATGSLADPSLTGSVADDVLMGGPGIDDLASFGEPMTEANIVDNPLGVSMRPGMQGAQIDRLFGPESYHSQLFSGAPPAPTTAAGAPPTDPGMFGSMLEGWKKLTPIEKTQLGLAGGSALAGLGTAAGSMLRPPLPQVGNLPQGSGASQTPTAAAAMAALTNQMSQRRGSNKLIG